MKIGKRMIETHMGFEVECRWWCFCHECFADTRSERKRDAWTVLLDNQGKW